MERPIAKPTKPSTGAACASQWSTFASLAPRPSTTQTTPSRPLPVRAWRDEHLAVLARVDALDLPDVHLDPGVLDRGDRAAHQLGAQLGVVAFGVAAHARQLGVLGGHEQLEQEPAVVLVQPVGEALELASLLAVALGVAVGVVAHEHLREVRVEALDVRAEVLAVLEVEHVLAAALHGHRQLQALPRAPPRGRWSRTAHPRARL